MRLAARAATSAAGGLALGLALALLLPAAFGGRPYTVLSGSMEPAIGAGDVVIGTRAKPLDVRPGDVVTFRDPGDARRLITHRVRRARVRGSKVVFTTKGDANNSTERWQVGTGEPLSRVGFRVPEIGRVALFAGRVEGLVMLVLLPLLLLGIHELVRIWRPPERAHGSAA